MSKKSLRKLRKAWTVECLQNNLVDPANTTVHIASPNAARIMDPLGTEAKLKDTIRTATPKVYYVIIGFGPAALCNHATLRQSEWGRKRLCQLPVAHIGHADPWGRYFQHGMGQPPYLLGMPGFARRPDPGKLHRGRTDSSEFAACTAAEWHRLVAAYPDHVFHVEGAAIVIQKGTNIPDKLKWDPTTPNAYRHPDSNLPISKVETILKLPYHGGLTEKEAPYRVAILFENGEAGLIYARYVDICSGAGRPTMLPAPQNGTPPVDNLPSRRAPPWIPGEHYWADPSREPTHLSGNEALLSGVPWNNCHRYANYGAGGVGLNMVERAEDQGVCLDWISRGSVFGNGMALPGNVVVLRDAGTSTAVDPTSQLAADIVKATDAKETALRSDIEKRIRPFCEKVRLVHDAAVTKAETVSDKVVLTITAPENARCVDAWTPNGIWIAGLAQTGCPFPFSPDYAKVVHADADAAKLDRFIWTIGQEGNSCGTAKTMSEHLGIAVLADGTLNIGMKSSDDAIRILGAAAQTHPENFMDFQAPTTGATNDTQRFFSSLPMSAVPPGFIYAGINIARANRFPSPASAPANVNVATTDELAARLEKAGCESGAARSLATTLAGDLAAAIVGERRGANGFASLDAVWRVAKMKCAAHLTEIQKLEKLSPAALGLDAAYPPAADYLTIDKYPLT